MKPRLLVVLALFALAGRIAASAEITLAPLFTDHAVLQRDKPLPIWGRATPGEKLSVQFAGQTVYATAAADGRWIVYLEPLAGTIEPSLLVVAGRETVVRHDVVVGEVWLASGQSNMQFPVAKLREEERRLTAVDLTLVRELHVQPTVTAAPAEQVETSGWKLASADQVGEFSAVAYFFARDVQRKLGIPVGIIHASQGATDIEAWMSDAARQSSPFAALIDARWQQAMSEWTPERIGHYPSELDTWQKAEARAKATRTRNPLRWPMPPATPDSYRRPGGLFNGTIAPLQPGAIRGVLWYQGEANTARPDEYAELFPALILSWRANWGDPTLPFLFVQLPAFADDNARGRQWARFREAQTRALELPGTWMAVAIDLGEPDDIHPSRKLELARRLALIAKTQVYDIPGDYSGPVFASATPEGSAMRVRFTHADSGLIARDRPAQGLELAGPDRVFHPATAKLERDTLLVTAKAVTQPVAVRYAWSNAPLANLYSGAGLPVAPFRSDVW